jgi:hypothetical protein
MNTRTKVWGWAALATGLLILAYTGATAAALLF